MSKILIFSDIHIFTHRRSTKRLDDCIKVLEWVFLQAEENKIKDVVFAGDLFHDRHKIDVMTYQLTFEVFEKYHHNKNIYLLLGNHDLWYHDKWDISSVRPFSAFPNIKIIDKPCTLEIQGYKVDFCPYTNDPIDYLNKLKKNKHKTLIGHLACHGAKLHSMYNTYTDVIIEHDGDMVIIDNSLFSNWEKVWLGHYHSQQKLNNVEYIGSPLQLSFGEAFQHKHIVIYDLEDGTSQYIRNNFSPQHFVIPEKDVEKYNITDNFIRLSVENLSSTDLINLKKGLNQFRPASLEILPIENKTDQKQIIEESKATLLNEQEMINKYLESIETNLDKAILLEVWTKIYQKAKQ